MRALDQANYNRMKILMSDSEVDVHPDEALSPVSNNKMNNDRNGAVPDGKVLVDDVCAVKTIFEFLTATFVVLKDTIY